MLNEFWNKLKSGSDIRAIAYEGVVNEEINLTNEVTKDIFLGFSRWLSEKTGLPCSALTVAIGNDSRCSAKRLKTAAISALTSVGINVYDCGLSSTPAMFDAISTLSCSASVEITASHHPANRNGFKFFFASGGISEENLERILEFAQNKTFPELGVEGNVRTVNTLQFYCEKIKKLIKKEINSQKDYEKPLDGIKILVDAGNGAGGFFAKDILEELGADVSESLFLEPNGNFPNHESNPEKTHVLEFVAEKVRKTSVDLGVVFDTDVDRVAFINYDGELINRNKLVAIASVIALEKSPNGIIVTDSVTSDNLKFFIERLGGTQFRYKRGYNNVIELAKKITKEGGNCPLAIETSGHACFKENNFIDDGAYLAAKVIAKMVKQKNQGETLKNLFENMKDAIDKKDFKIEVKGENISKCVAEVLEELKVFADRNPKIEREIDNIEGVRLKFKDDTEKGWCLVRQSVHDPVLIVYAESYIKGGADSIFGILKPFFEEKLK